jgi:hypothetical protein
MFTLLNDLLGRSPFVASSPDLAARLGPVPVTTLVSENDDVIVMGSQAQGYQLRSGKGAWVPYKQ